MEVFITKYALTKGIFSLDVEDEGNGYVRSKRNALELYHKRDWYLTKEEAVSRAEEMRSKKIASLKAQIDSLGKMKFC